MLTRQLFNLDTAKRPADRDVGADRAAKRSKTVPDAATIRAVQERINSIEADQLNSDNNFVGAFDDEDIRSDEHEDEIDLDIVVGAIWFLFTRSSTLSLSLDSPVVQRPCPCDPTACDQTPTRRCSRGSMSFFFHLITPTTISQICQTPIWNQPEPDLPAPDNTEGNISDDDNEGELTIHEREHHKLRWPPKTRLVHPARGRWSLWVQNSSVEAAIQDAFPLAQRYIASINAFPYLQEKVKMGRDVLYQAATRGGLGTIADTGGRGGLTWQVH